eukprot:NODE_2094_length_1299_cov_28.766400_g1906_i0.p1 GENE.NODE_2094_length_1299_cov_28.766400_g1906_i0~~NODE_2094_length_1299_cov_28.766400_g1906_i0.p1  ORF type:complete len:345 (-),score=77.17 NODE_2094_length_1299_cov_28.766400_g1906_i0:136-1170(-)
MPSKLADTVIASLKLEDFVLPLEYEGLRDFEALEQEARAAKVIESKLLSSTNAVHRIFCGSLEDLQSAQISRLTRLQEGLQQAARERSTRELAALPGFEWQKLEQEIRMLLQAQKDTFFDRHVDGDRDRDDPSDRKLWSSVAENDSEHMKREEEKDRNHVKSSSSQHDVATVSFLDGPMTASAAAQHTGMVDLLRRLPRSVTPPEAAVTPPSKRGERRSGTVHVDVELPGSTIVPLEVPEFGDITAVAEAFAQRYELPPGSVPRLVSAVERRKALITLDAHSGHVLRSAVAGRRESSRSCVPGNTNLAVKWKRYETPGTNIIAQRIVQQQQQQQHRQQQQRSST